MGLSALHDQVGTALARGGLTSLLSAISWRRAKAGSGISSTRRACWVVMPLPRARSLHRTAPQSNWYILTIYLLEVHPWALQHLACC